MGNFKNFQRRYKENTKLLNITKYAVDLIIALCAAFVLVNFTCDKTTISGNSMHNQTGSTLENGDVVLISELKYAFSKPKRYDIIAFKRPNVTSSKIYIKRVIGLPGETIQIKDGKVYINNSQLEDDLISDNILSAGIVATELSLGEDEYFVLGDNRNNSEDSRFSNIGTVKEKDILGVPWLIVSPVKHFKLIK